MSYIVYRLFNEDQELFYIGSTKMTLRKRMNNHRAAAKGGSSSRLHQAMRESGPENWQIEVLEQVPSANELKEKEQEFIDELSPPLNENRAYGIDEERSRVRKRVNLQGWQNANRDRVNSGARVWRAANPNRYGCSCGYRTGDSTSIRRHVSRGQNRGEGHGRVVIEQEDEEDE